MPCCALRQTADGRCCAAQFDLDKNENAIRWGSRFVTFGRPPSGKAYDRRLVAAGTTRTAGGTSTASAASAGAAGNRTAHATGARGRPWPATLALGSAVGTLTSLEDAVADAVVDAVGRIGTGRVHRAVRAGARLARGAAGGIAVTVEPLATAGLRRTLGHLVETIPAGAVLRAVAAIVLADVVVVTAVGTLGALGAVRARARLFGWPIADTDLIRQIAPTARCKAATGTSHGRAGDLSWIGRGVARAAHVGEHEEARGSDSDA
jgi:hypothetical protein